MKNKLFLLLIGLFLSASAAFAQNKGNATIRQNMGNENYQSRSINRRAEIPRLVRQSNENVITLSANAMYNLTASSYVAVFSLSQVGETIQETDKLMNERIEKIKKGVEELGIENLRVYVDMISLTPVFEYEVSKKIFSKDTYTEVPKGFEMKKNLHIRYKDHEVLDKIITICAASEVYDLAKVDYYVENSEAIHDTLRKRAATFIKEKMDYYKDLGIDLSEKRRVISEADQTFFPVERYTSYQAYTNNSLNTDVKSEVRRAPKPTAFYYRPVSSSHYDIVVHPEIIEPAIQYTFTLNVKFFLKDEAKPKPAPKPRKEVYLILPNGDMKNINFDN